MPEVIDVIGELYTPLLNSLDIYEENNRLVRKFIDEEHAFTVEGKNIILPTSDNLRKLDLATSVPFHPLSENVARRDSRIQNVLKQAVTVRLTFCVVLLTQTLLEMLANPDNHAKLKSNQLDILTAVPDVNEKTFSNFATALGKIDLSTVKAVNIYNKRSGEIDGNKYHRASIITFPLFMELLNPAESKVWGVSSIRKKDIAAYRALLDYVLPDWDKPNTYSAGSDSLEAPNFIALVKSYANVASRLNELFKKFKTFFKAETKQAQQAYTDALIKDLSYIKLLENVGRYRGIIPPLEGNIGGVVAGEEEVQEEIVRVPRGVPPRDLMNNLNKGIGDVPADNDQAVQQRPQTIPPAMKTVEPQMQNPPQGDYRQNENYSTFNTNQGYVSPFESQYRDGQRQFQNQYGQNQWGANAGGGGVPGGGYGTTVSGFFGGNNNGGQGNNGGSGHQGNGDALDSWGQGAARQNSQYQQQQYGRGYNPLGGSQGGYGYGHQTHSGFGPGGKPVVSTAGLPNHNQGFNNGGGYSSNGAMTDNQILLQQLQEQQRQNEMMMRELQSRNGGYNGGYGGNGTGNQQWGSGQQYQSNNGNNNPLNFIRR